MNFQERMNNAMDKAIEQNLADFQEEMQNYSCLDELGEVNPKLKEKFEKDAIKFNTPSERLFEAAKGTLGYEKERQLYVNIRFSKNPVRQAIHETTMIEHLINIPQTSVVNLTKSKQYIDKHGSIVVGKAGEAVEDMATSLDVDITHTSIPNIIIHTSLKYGTAAGGAQDRQCSNLVEFLRSGLVNNCSNEVFAVIYAGPYYDQSNKITLLKKEEHKGKLYQTHIENFLTLLTSIKQDFNIK